MAINPTPFVQVVSALDATQNNEKNITYSIIGQVESIISAEARIYLMSTGEQICTYVNNTVPTETAKGYLFPIDVVDNNSQVTWTTGHSVNDWSNGTEYFIKIRTLSNSGWTQYSTGQPFICSESITATFVPIQTPITTTNISLSVNTISQTNNMVSTYQFILLDKYGNIISISDTLYNTNNGDNFTYTFNGLKNGNEYQAIFTATTSMGNIVNQTSDTFTVASSISLVGIVEATNDCNNGKISVSFKGSSNSNINVVALERQEVGQENWIRLHEEYITDLSNISFVYSDYYNKQGVSYTYRVVPIYRQGDYNSNGTPVDLSGVIESIFYGVFISDGNKSYKLIVETSIDNLLQNQTVNSLNPIGTQYPITVKNAKNNYQSGSISAKVIDSKLHEDGFALDMQSRYNMRQLREELQQFFTDGSAKVLKDYNGNLWVIDFTESPSITFDSGTTMGIANISCGWVEVGNVDNENLLSQLGLTNIIKTNEG